MGWFTFFSLFCAATPAVLRGLDEQNELRKVGSGVQKSIVQISITDRLGKEISVGTGFAVLKPGLIATNLHVIGEGRSFVVKDVNGEQIDVTHVHASDRFADLAILQIKQSHLKPLELADFSKVKKGQPFVAIGHPQGLENSLVQGVVSSKRMIEGRRMLQVAMPVESGNSGGPVVNAQGQVIGVVTMKSLATNNIGFAIGSDQIKNLIAKPNPVEIGKWLKIGVLRPDTWQPKFGASWRQRGGRILSHSVGDGFGGRTICVFQKDLPELPFEISVEVKLADESGAAGLAFRVDQQDRHYGFYPSNQKLRFSRFEGPTPLEWTVLSEHDSSSYKPGQWNHLKVRLEKDRTIAFVNNQKVGEFKDLKIAGTQVGLAKFRDTIAEFRQFRVGKTLHYPSVPEADQTKLLENLQRDINNSTFEKILSDSQKFPGPSRKLILDNVSQLEQKIKRLRQLAESVHVADVRQNFTKIVQQKRDEDIDLIAACLWIARLDDPDHEIDGYLELFDCLADELKQEAEGLDSDEKKLALLNQFLFEQNGFHGSRHEYYRPENSYLSHVLEDREGIPITLAILYIELGRRLGISIDGIGLPGHFVVAHNRKKQTPQLIDVFDGGKLISKEDAKFIVASTTARGWDENYLSPVSKKQILFRVLLNLRGIAESQDDRDAILRYLELMFVLDPDDVAIKGTRALLLFQKGFHQKAIRELDQIIEKRPTGLNLRMLESMRRRLKAQMDREQLTPKNSD